MQAVFVRFDIQTAVIVKVTVIWDVMLCSPVGMFILHVSVMEVASSETSAHSRQHSAHSRKWLFSNTVWAHELQINEIFWYFIPVFVDI